MWHYVSEREKKRKLNELIQHPTTETTLNNWLAPQIAKRQKNAHNSSPKIQLSLNLKMDQQINKSVVISCFIIHI